MGLSIHPVEVVWLLSSGAGLVLALAFLWDAWHLRNVGNGARRLIARGNIRREAFRTVAQTLLLIVIVPGLFVDREIVLSLPIAALITVPVVLLAAALLDAVERRRLVRLTLRDVRVGRR